MLSHRIKRERWPITCHFMVLVYFLALFLLPLPLWSEPRKPEDDLMGTPGKNLCFSYKIPGDTATVREYAEKARQLADTGRKCALAFFHSSPGRTAHGNGWSAHLAEKKQQQKNIKSNKGGSK